MLLLFFCHFFLFCSFKRKKKKLTSLSSFFPFLSFLSFLSFLFFLSFFPPAPVLPLKKKKKKKTRNNNSFDDADVVHVEDRVDPVADLEIIHDELRTKDLERARGIVKDFRDREKKPPPMTKEQKEEMAAAVAVEAWLESGKDVRFGDWNAKEVDFLNAHPMITAKPVVYLVNLTEKAYVTKKSKWLPKVHAWVQEHGGDPIIPFSGSLESRLFEMPEDEKAKELEQLGENVTSALSKIITAGFKAVQLQYFFTAGEDEVKCWQIRKGTKAPQAAGAIHTDFERGFICAEVMKFDELKELGTEAAVKAAGKYRQEGKGYVVGDSDIIYFKFNVTSSKK